MTILISGFPGIGKSFSFEHSSLRILNYCSVNVTARPDTLKDLCDLIQDGFLNEWDYIFVTYSKMVNEELRKLQIPYIVVYPELDSKTEYQKRLQSKDRSEKWVCDMLDSWDELIVDIQDPRSIDYYNSIELSTEQYLSDIFNFRFIYN